MASDNRGTREYMKDGENGYICKYDDVSGFLRGIRKIQRQTMDEKEQMAKKCRASVERFDKKYSNKIMREIYEEVDKRVVM